MIDYLWYFGAICYSLVLLFLGFFRGYWVGWNSAITRTHEAIEDVCEALRKKI